MLAASSSKPFNDKDWIFEIKWDGYRAMASINEGIVKLYSRNHKILNDKFKPVIDSLQKLPYDALFDGEVVVVDNQGRSDFSKLQKYIKEGTGNIVYYVFDIVYYENYRLTDVPLIERKKILEKILPPLPYIKISGHIENTGIPFFETAKANSLEGIMAKKASSKYLPLKRSKDWIKIKTKHSHEVVIGGFTQPDKEAKTAASFAVGIYKSNKLIYIGNIGSGLKDSEIKNLYDKLKEITIPSSPFSNIQAVSSSITGVRPELVAEVQYSQLTPSGMMRHPVFVRLREDKDPLEVIDELSDAIDTANKVSPVSTIINYRGRLSNPDKIFWEDQGYSKGDLLDYYFKVSEFILPHLAGRPQSLHRHPDGIKGESFFQKDINFKTPSWIKTFAIANKEKKKDIHYLICSDLDSLIYMANLGCIEINPWLSRMERIDYPDFIVIDLDPFEIEFKSVIKVALRAKEVLDILDIKGFIKTSGATGMHIFIPIGKNYDYGQASKFAKILAIIIHRKIPGLTSIERSPLRRHNKVYIDFLQNRKGQTIASAYSVRPRPGAPVSAPLHWDEVSNRRDPSEFNIKSMFKRLDKYGDIWKDIFLDHTDLEDSLPRIEEFYKDETS
jgi:bifunctional non-homologous end joining protein LigD